MSRRRPVRARPGATPWQERPPEDRQRSAGIEHPPGQSALDHRVGTFRAFAAEILDTLIRADGREILTTPSAEVSFKMRRREPADGDSAENGKTPRQIHFNLDDTDNWLVGLIQAWAMTADVLTFYQERILNEGFLATARDRLSLHELARMLDARPRPGLGARLDLVVTVTDVQGLPRRLLLPAGAMVQAQVPGADAPLVFETEAALEAHSRWNRLEPEKEAELVPQELVGTSPAVVLTSAPGLEAGSPILVTGRRGDAEVACFKRLRAVEPREATGLAPAGVAAVWGEPLDPATGGGEITDVEVYALRQESGLFGANAPAWNDQPLDVQRRQQPIQGGVQIYSPAEGWQTANSGLPASTVRCLGFDTDGHLYAATEGFGIHRRAGGRATEDAPWQPGGRGLERLDLLAFAADPRGALLAGTADGDLYRSTDGGEVWTLLTGRSARAASGWNLPRRRSRRLERLPETAVRAIWIDPEGPVSQLFVGTDHGVYRSTDLGASWRPHNRGLPGVDADTGETDLVISGLVGLGTERLVAATPKGIFTSSRDGRRWQAANRGLPGIEPLSGHAGPVRAVAAQSDRRQGIDLLVAATAEGVFRSTDGGERWEPARRGLESVAGTVTALAILGDPLTLSSQIFAASKQGLFVSEDGGESWRPVELGGEVAVTALATSPAGGRLAVATPFGGFAEDEWPGFEVAGAHIELDAAPPGLAAGGFVALEPLEDAPGRPMICRIRRTDTVRRQAFGLDARVQRLEIEPEIPPDRFHRRRTRVLLRSERLDVAGTPRPLAPSAALEAIRTELLAMNPERPVLVAGRRTATAAGDRSDPSFSRRTTAGALADELHGSFGTVSGRTVSGGTVSGDAAPVLELPDILPDGSPGEGRILVDPSTLVIYGNVAPCTEGATLRRQILGDGDAAATLQRFPLGSPPAFVGGVGTARSTIEIRVQDQVWDEVPRLYGAGESRVYQLELDHEGRGAVVFGDGGNGARLPSGHDNVLATYRTGMTSCAVPPKSANLANPPLGIHTATNPFPGTPGSPPEPEEELRRQVPRSLRTFDRIVSLGDYEDFALLSPAVAKARAGAVATSNGRIVHLSVAGTDGVPLSAERLAEMRAEIESIRADRTPVHLAPAIRVPLEIEATVRLARGFKADEVEPRLLVALDKRFGFDRAGFGDVLSPAEATRILQDVAGVLAVDVDLFRPSILEPDSHNPDSHNLDDDNPEEPRRTLRARPARWDPPTDAIRPAELIVLAERRLRLEEAS